MKNNGWISVEDQLPEKGKDVLFLAICSSEPSGWDVQVGYLTDNCERHELHFEDKVEGLYYPISGEYKEVYYWRSLPEFPEE